VEIERAMKATRWYSTVDVLQSRRLISNVVDSITRTTARSKTVTHFSGKVDSSEQSVIESPAERATVDRLSALNLLKRTRIAAPSWNEGGLSVTRVVRRIADMAISAAPRDDDCVLALSADIVDRKG
jgi:hypothetical protein